MTRKPLWGGLLEPLSPTTHGQLPTQTNTNTWKPIYASTKTFLMLPGRHVRVYVTHKHRRDLLSLFPFEVTWLTCAWHAWPCFQCRQICSDSDSQSPTGRPGCWPPCSSRPRLPRKERVKANSTAENTIMGLNICYMHAIYSIFVYIKCF